MSSLLPPNATTAERALDEATARIGAVDVPIGELWDPWTCPAALLPWLAWALHVDEWNSSWTVDVKRRLIADSMELHRIKGTRGAVEMALANTGFPEARIEEWFEYAGDPGYFSVVIELLDQGIDEVTFNLLVARIERYKNVRSWLERLDLWLTSRFTNYWATVLHAGESITVYPFRTTEREVSGIVYHAIGLQAVETISVYPQ